MLKDKSGNYNKVIKEVEWEVYNRNSGTTIQIVPNEGE